MNLVWFMSQQWNLFVKRFHSRHKSEGIVSYLFVVNCWIYPCFLFVCIHLINSLGYSWFVCILVLNRWIFLMCSLYKGDVVFVLRFLSFWGKIEIVYLLYEREILIYIAMCLSIQEKLFVNIKTWQKKPQLLHTYKRINFHTGSSNKNLDPDHPSLWKNKEMIQRRSIIVCHAVFSHLMLLVSI